MNTRYTFRRGYTLTELLVVIATLSVVLGVLVVSLNTMFVAQGRLRKADDFERTLYRLSLRLRIDAHQADSARLVGDDSLVLTSHQQATIRYTSKAHQIERIERDADAVIHRETFPLPAHASTTWHVLDRRQAEMVAVDIELNRAATATGPSPGMTSLRLLAAIGINHAMEPSN